MAGTPRIFGREASTEGVSDIQKYVVNSPDIFVLSNPSKCSIKVLSIKMEQEVTQIEVQNQADSVIPVQGELKMAEGSTLSNF